MSSLAKRLCHDKLSDMSARERFDSHSAARQGVVGALEGAAWADANPRAFAALQRQLCGAWMAGDGVNATHVVAAWLRHNSRRTDCMRQSMRDQVRLAASITRYVRDLHPEWFAK